MNKRRIWFLFIFIVFHGLLAIITNALLVFLGVSRDYVDAITLLIPMVSVMLWISAALTTIHGSGDESATEKILSAQYFAWLAIGITLSVVIYLIVDGNRFLLVTPFFLINSGFCHLCCKKLLSIK